MAIVNNGGEPDRFALLDIFREEGCCERHERYEHQEHDVEQLQGGNARKLSVEQTADPKARLHQYKPDQVLAAELRVSRGAFWTVSDLRLVVQQWYGVSYQSDDTYLKLLHDCGFSYQRSERVYRSRSSEQQIAQFEATLEKSDRLSASPS